MGNNFYLYCEQEKLHIGRSGYGWEFIFEAHPKLNIYSWEDWQEHLDISLRSPNYILIDDENNRLSLDEFVDVVDAKKRQERYGEGKLLNHFDELQREEFEKRILLRQQRGLPFTDIKLKETSVCNVWKDADGYAVVLGEFA